MRLRQQIDELIYAEISERRAKNDLSGEDILSLMMSARDEEGQAMTDVELRDELMTLLFAGHETTATAIAFAQFEMKLVLATILSHWQLELSDRRPLKPVRRGVTMAPSGGVQMVVTGSRY